MSQNIKVKSNKKNGAAELFIRVAKAYKESDFYSLYTELRERFPEVAKYLEDNTSPERWSRAKQTGNRYSIMTTNGVESINGRLREERELPIIALLEALQRITSTWRSKYRQEAVASTTHLTPAIESIIRENFIVSRKYEVIEATEGKYCVYGSTSNELVDLQSKSCTCRKFDIDKIPCSHAIAAAYNENISVYELCTDDYTTRYWLKAYTDPVYPVPGDSSNVNHYIQHVKRMYEDFVYEKAMSTWSKIEELRMYSTDKRQYLLGECQIPEDLIA
ncbi:uncharacterized protein [Henckelia pumila]|uniref:uncharacterized protein n=1 Tax=Henckelia pumila TaxID=405737 RepID=UPI003C6EA0FF